MIDCTISPVFFITIPGTFIWEPSAGRWMPCMRPWFMSTTFLLKHHIIPTTDSCKCVNLFGIKMCLNIKAVKQSILWILTLSGVARNLVLMFPCCPSVSLMEYLGRSGTPSSFCEPSFGHSFAKCPSSPHLKQPRPLPWFPGAKFTPNAYHRSTSTSTYWNAINIVKLVWLLSVFS